MRIVFAGTPDFAAISLRALLARPEHEVLAVYTQPDRPAGRGRHLCFSPVKQAALERDIPVLQPQTLRDEADARRLSACAPDIMVVVAYGLLLPPAILTIPAHGCLNVHASLLPRWRGAAPIQRALLAGDQVTGVSIMRMTAGLDTGPVFARAALPIAMTDTAGSLHDKLAGLGARTLLATLTDIAVGAAVATPQPDEGATYAAKLTKEEALLDWRGAAAQLALAVRAFSPVPGARVRLAGHELRIWEARALPQPTGASPGTVLAASATGIDVATGAGVLRLLRLQQPGRRPVSAADYVNAHQDLTAGGGDRTPGPA